MTRKKSMRRGIARQQQVIAIVDHHAERRIEIGAAAPARLPRRLIDDDVPLAAGELHGGGEAGEAGADDMDGGLLRHARSSERDRGGARRAESRHFDALMRVRGGAKPRAVSCARIG